MNAVLFGATPAAVTFAKMLKKANDYPQNGGITVGGVFCKTVKETATVAVELNVSAYICLEDAIKHADILLIAYPDSTIPRFINALKEHHVRGKILCHFSTKYDSDILSCGTTNSCYSITLPYYLECSGERDITNTTVIIEGNGRKDTEFKEALFSSLSNPVFCTKDNKRLSNIASRIVSICIRSFLEFAVHLYKIAGVYNRNAFFSFIKDTVNGTLAGKVPVTKLDSDEIKKNLKLLNTVNYSDTKEFYKNMETHIVNNRSYPFEEKEKLVRILKQAR